MHFPTMKSYLDAEEQVNDEYRKIFLSNEEYEEYEASNKTLHQRSKTPEEKKKRKALNDKINKHYNSIGRFAYGEEDYNRYQFFKYYSSPSTPSSQGSPNSVDPVQFHLGNKLR